MTDTIETKQGDVVVTATEPTNIMFHVWIVSNDGQQHPALAVDRVMTAMGTEAATALAEQMARCTRGSVVVHQNLEGGQVPADPLVMPGNKRKAKELIAKLAVGRLTREDDEELENAIENDLNTASQQGASSEARLIKVEAQVHALSDAVVAIAEPSDTVDGAVKTVKDKM